MKAALFELLVVCLLGALHAGANTRPEEMGVGENEDEQLVGKRYAESAVASQLSKIMDSMAQKHFVDFLLNQRVKKSKLLEEDPEEGQNNDLLKLRLQEKHRRKI